MFGTAGGAAGQIAVEPMIGNGLAWDRLWIAMGIVGLGMGLVAGLASGAAMLPYTLIKEANPPQLGGTATGVINFLTFTFSAPLGPIFAWILQHVSAGAEKMALEHYQAGFAPLLLGVAVATVLSIS